MDKVCKIIDVQESKSKYFTETSKRLIRGKGTALKRNIRNKSNSNIDDHKSINILLTLITDLSFAYETIFVVAGII